MHIVRKPPGAAAAVAAVHGSVRNISAPRSIPYIHGEAPPPGLLSAQATAGKYTAVVSKISARLKLHLECSNIRGPTRENVAESHTRQNNGKKKTHCAKRRSSGQFMSRLSHTLYRKGIPKSKLQYLLHLLCSISERGQIPPRFCNEGCRLRQLLIALP